MWRFPLTIKTIFKSKNLMDESRSKRRLMRRLILAALITNAGTLSSAAEPKDLVPFRDLLMEGWQTSSAESKLTFQGPQVVEPTTPTLTPPTQTPDLRPISSSNPSAGFDEGSRSAESSTLAEMLQAGPTQPHRLIKGKSVNEEPQLGRLASSITKPLSTEPQSVLVLEPSKPQELTLPQTLDIPPALQDPIADLSETDDEIETTESSGILRGAARRRGFGMLAIDQIGEPVLPGQPVKSELSLTETIHANKLLELAREQLREATDRMHRNATHSAKKLTLKALRNVVTMKDVQAGGNHHAKQLEAAMEAIRESEDFTGKFGPVDQDALVRLVTVHETKALKEAALQEVSSLRATEMYLAVARENLIAATYSIREASEALVLMGQIEKILAEDSEMHGAALAVTLQRAAIEVDPSNAVGFYELGSTLLSQGLVDEAFEALSRSVSLRPNRSGYEQLLKAARQVGDVTTAQQCIAALRNPNLSRHNPVRRMQPQAFAATYRPSNTMVARNAQPKQVEAQPASAKTPAKKRVGLFRSIFTPSKK